MASESPAPSVAQSAVLGESASMPADAEQCQGYDFNNGVDYSRLFDAYRFHGFQATNLGAAITEIRRMRAWRLSDEEVKEDEDEELRDPEARKNVKAKIFLGYTSNQISCGNRETIRFLCEHKMVDVVVTTAGGIEEDLMKCLAPTYMGDFSLKGRELRLKGINRLGNLLVPNHNYCLFENWMNPLLHQMLDEQEEGTIWTPSKMIHRLGQEINDESSVYYWCYKNNIPVFCPAITDGSIGDMLYFFSYKRQGFILDIARDIRLLNDEAVNARATGMIILGGGLVKHHICNANLMRNGANFSVFVNTANEFDGSDSGARPDEAVSWGKIRIDAKPVKVYSDATLVFPILVAETFAKDLELEAAQSG
uniref:deoxyhypusine synthase n=1 Tax=Pinguiococcus pyrenoidosus TaxID=172671 RepID=A0A7R9YFK2_9STRA